MVVVPFILAVFQVYLFWQVPFWGALPICILGFLYVFRDEARMAELSTAALVFSFVASIFLSPISGLFYMLAIVAASYVTMGAYRILSTSRFKKLLKRTRHLFFSIVFVGVWLAVSGLRFTGDYSVRQLVGVGAFSIVLNASILLLLDIAPVKRRQGAHS